MEPSRLLDCGGTGPSAADDPALSCPLTQGNADTLHVVKPPSGMAQFIGLAAMEVSVRPQGPEALLCGPRAPRPASCARRMLR